uniref:Tonsoku-like protein n=1 Tax=Pristionchus pacificus TaxID=54126 RepID=A0A8R1Z0G6_PRIPA
MKKKVQKTIQELRSNIASARIARNYRRVSDLLLEHAQFLRSIGERDEAIEEFQNVLDIAGKANVRTDEILASRGIAEIQSEKGEYEECVKFLKMYEHLAKTDPTEYQLMLTVGSYCFIKLYTVDEKNENLLQQARDYAEKSLHLLDTEEMDPEKMLQGDKISIRRCNCHRMIAEIAGYQNNKEVGERHSKAAFDHADLKNQFEIMRARIDFPWRNKVIAAEDLCKLADSSMKAKRVEAHLFLAQAFFEQRQIEKGSQILLELYEEASNTRTSGVSEDDRERYNELLIFAFRARVREKQLKKCDQEKDRSGQYLKNDKLGDLYNNAGFKNAAFLHYQAAINLSESTEQKRATLVSCAETAADLKKFNDAARYFERVQSIENEEGMDTSETRASLFEMRLSAGEFDSDADVNLAVDQLEKEMNNKKFLISVYSATSKYYEIKGNTNEATRFRMLENNFAEQFSLDGCVDDDHDNQENHDSLDEISDDEILEIMRGEALKKAKRKALAKAGRKENQYGETKLIERAREGTLDEVKILLSQGADVNRADPVGWTPLSEAVGANNLEIVKLLLAKGANPNSQSKDGFANASFGGKITPLMEACTNGFHEIARWLLNHPSANTLVTAINVDGWSPADFMSDYLKRAARGTESEAEFQQHLNACKELLEKIQQMQRRQGFPVRQGDPPPPLPKSDDTPRFAAEKEKATRRARMSDKRKGAANDYQDAIYGIGSKSRTADKENKKKYNKTDDDLFDDDDDEESFSSPPPSIKKIRRVVELSSDSSEEEIDVHQGNNEKNRHRKSRDFYDDPNFGLDTVERKPVSQHVQEYGGNRPKKVSGVHLILEKKKGKKRSVEFGDENGVIIVPDDFEIQERCVSKRKRNDSDNSQSESEPIVPTVPISRRDLIDNVKEPLDYDSLRPPVLVSTTVKVIIEMPGLETNLTVLSKAPSDTYIADLPKHIDKVRNAINGSSCEWMSGEDIIEESKITLSDLSSLTELKVVEIRCIVKKTLKEEFEKMCDVCEVNGPLSDALRLFETGRTPQLVINDGSKYSEKTRDALWRAIDAYSLEKTKENGQWRAQTVKIERIDVPTFALRSLIRMRPRETLSLRHCSVDDSDLEAMVEEMDSSDITTLECDLSYNEFVNPGENIAKMIRKCKVNTLILQGLSSIVHGCDLMANLRGLALNVLVLDENPWLDDVCMQELVNDDAIGKLSMLKVSRCALKTMEWMEGHESFKSLKILNLSENNCISPAGWDRVAAMIRSPSTSLKILDISGTAVRSMVLNALASRSSDAALLSLTIAKCNGISPSEICRVLGHLVKDERSSTNFKLLLEKEKIEEVRAIAPLLAAKTLKISTN